MIVAETPRLVLRRVVSEDAMAWQAIFCDPQVMRFGGPVRTPKWVHDTIADMIGRRYGEWSFGRWSVVEKATGAVIGVVGLARYPDRSLQTGEAEIGYRFNLSCWGAGYATESASVACAVGFDAFTVSRIVAHVAPANRGSIRVAEKIGMGFDRVVQLPDQDPENRYVLDPPVKSREPQA